METAIPAMRIRSVLPSRWLEPATFRWLDYEEN